MNEQQFIELLLSYELKVRDTIIPTRAMTTIYGEAELSRVIRKEHEEVFYGFVAPMEISDEDLNRQLALGKNYADILYNMQKNYEDYLKNLKKRIDDMQEMWSNSFADQRASLIIGHLAWINVYHVCDAVADRIVPFELVLKRLFNVDSYYGQYRQKKAKSEILVDNRLLNPPKWTKNKGY